MYHVPDYVTLDARLYGGAPAAFWFERDRRRLLIPLIVRDIPGSGLRDALSPYGYPGPVSDAAPEDDDFWDAACTAFIETLRAQGVITAFMRMHPLQTSSRSCAPRIPQPQPQPQQSKRRQPM